jgi:CRP/FNR family cyclic AMP-dependent transcriptional regulator
VKKLSFRPGQFIFKSGEKSTEIFLLVEGEVGIFLPYNETKVPDHNIGANEIFGEMGVIEGKLRMAHSRAMTDASVMAVSKLEFEAKIESTDPFVRGLVRILSSRIRDLQDKRH